MKKIAALYLLILLLLAACITDNSASNNQEETLPPVEEEATVEMVDFPIFINGNNKTKNLVLCPFENLSKMALVEPLRWAVCKSGALHRVHYQRYFEWDCNHREEGFYYSGAVFALDDTTASSPLLAGDVPELLVPDHYLATYEFLPIEPHEYSKPAIDMPAEFKQQMEATFQRKVATGRQVMCLKDRNARLAITEFELDTQNGEAMIVFAWLENDQIVATLPQTTTFNPEFFRMSGGRKVYYSVWRVDDEGEYGMPYVSGCAVAKDGSVDLFIEHEGAEGINYRILRVKDGKMEMIIHDGFDYVYYHYC